jgi:hypothetical protein
MRTIACSRSGPVDGVSKSTRQSGQRTENLAMKHLSARDVIVLLKSARDSKTTDRAAHFSSQKTQHPQRRSLRSISQVAEPCTACDVVASHSIHLCANRNTPRFVSDICDQSCNNLACQSYRPACTVIRPITASRQARWLGL